MLLYLVYDHTEYASDSVIAVFDTEDAARDYARTADLFTDARSIARAELNNPDYGTEQIAMQWRDQQGEF